MSTYQTPIQNCLATLNDVVLGKPWATKLALTCLFAKGHLLIEDLPGMGKTTLAHALAASLGLEYKRVQFTSDLLPSDLLGFNMFNREQNSFEFLAGPIFSQVLLADEINRATPKAQSALLESMEERQVTIEGETHRLDDQFFVIATQNPSEQSGTYPLPESQLDRFMMRLSLGYPDPSSEKALLSGENPRERIKRIDPVMNTETLRAIQHSASAVVAKPAVIDYVHRLVSYSRMQAEVHVGLSPRASLSLLGAAKSWALIEGRDHVLPDDVQAVFPYIAEHRIDQSHTSSQHSASQKILAAVDIF